MFEDYREAAGFLAAIRERPDDPTPRLVFSDWLEERGDPRAAWLRDPEVWAWLAPDVRDPLPPLLALFLEDGPLEARWLAQDVLKKLGPPVVPAVRDWTRADSDTRWDWSRWTLETVPPQELRAVGELVAALKDPSWYECWQAVIDLGFHGPAAASAVGALCELQRHDAAFDAGDHDWLEEAVIAVLYNLGAAAVEAIPYLIGRLNGRANVREDAADALHAVGPHAPDAVLANLEVVDSDDLGTALAVLVGVHPEGPGVLARVLRGEPALYYGPFYAAMYLVEAAHDERTAALVPALVEVLQRHPVPNVYDCRAEAANALAALGEPARAAVPALRDVLASLAGAADRHLERVRQAVAAALDVLDPPAPIPQPRRKRKG